MDDSTSVAGRPQPDTPTDKRAAEGPIAGAARIGYLDALRGIALLGILIANVRQMMLPWDVGNLPVSIGGSERLAWLDWRIFYTFVDLKFIAIFSLLFGVGFALQSQRIAARDANFNVIYLRRLFILALFGIAHGVLLYPAEVLLLYACGGALLFAMRGMSVDNLYRVGLILLGTTLIWGYQIGSLGHISLSRTTLSAALLSFAVFTLWRRSWRAALLAWAIALLVAATITTLNAYPDIRADGVAEEFHQAQQYLAAMSSPDAAPLPEEVSARRSGDIGALLSLNAHQYSQILFYFLIMLLWQTLAFFMLGAAVFRSGLIEQTTPERWRRVAMIGLGLGLPLTAIATCLYERDMLGIADLRFGSFLHSFSALFLAVGLAAMVFLFQSSTRMRSFWVRIEAAGRMALTNYVGQSFVMALIAEPWGLGLYGRYGGPALTGLAIVVFGLLAATSYEWLKRYRMGPLEWVWRCATYWRWLPNQRAA